MVELFSCHSKQSSIFSNPSFSASNNRSHMSPRKEVTGFWWIRFTGKKELYSPMSCSPFFVRMVETTTFFKYLSYIQRRSSGYVNSSNSRYLLMVLCSECWVNRGRFGSMNFSNYLLGLSRGVYGRLRWVLSRIFSNSSAGDNQNFSFLIVRTRSGCFSTSAIKFGRVSVFFCRRRPVVGSSISIFFFFISLFLRNSSNSTCSFSSLSVLTSLATYSILVTVGCTSISILLRNCIVVSVSHRLRSLTIAHSSSNW